MKQQSHAIVLFFILVLALSLCVPVSGQVLKGSISGTVTDDQGAPLPGAEIKATSTTTQEVFSATSGHRGLFRINLLPPGNYTIEIATRGRKIVDGKVLVVAGRDTGLGSIKVGIDNVESIQFSADTALVDSTQSQITSAVHGTELANFSGVQENEGLDSMGVFVPGVTSSRSNNFARTNGSDLSANGLRSRSNDQQIDGGGNNDLFATGPAVLVGNSEFVQQYVIASNQFAPEFGRNAGSVVNLITRSGTDRWRGSIYGSENNSYLNALSNTPKRFIPSLDTFAPPLSGPPRLNDEFSGFTIGGPVIKEKLFIFGGFDNEIMSANNIYFSPLLTPTPAGLAQLAGCFPGSTSLFALTRFGPFAFSAGNPIPATHTFTPVNIGFCPNVPFAAVERTLSTPTRGFDWILKADLQLGNDTISSRYIFNRNNSFNAESGSAAAGYPINSLALSQQALISWTHNFSSHMVNEARVSFGRLNAQLGGNEIGTIPTIANLNQAVTSVIFNDTFLGFGGPANLPQGRITNTWQGQDNWSYVLGRHSLKAGVNYSYLRSPSKFLPNINGQYRFNDWLSFINNQPSSVLIANGNTSFDFREHDTFLYVGDDWKLSHNLTLNLGLTWSYYGQPANLLNDLTTSRENNASTAFWDPALPLGVRTFPNIDTYNTAFGPSVGFAYAPQWGGFLTGNGKTVIRGGYRLAYDPPFYDIYSSVAASAPMAFLQSFNGADAATKHLPMVPTGPNVRFSLAPFLTPGVLDPRSQNQVILPKNFAPDRVHSWTLGFERELSKKAVIEARYIGNRADNLFQPIDANPYIAALQADFPALVPAGLAPCPAASAVVPQAIGRVNCNAGVVESIGNTGYSYYHALQTEFRADNLFDQLTLRTGYTWSKTTDNVSEIFSTANAGNTNTFSQIPFSFTGAEYGISGIDFPHRWTLAFTEQLPFFKEQHGAIGHLLGGWGLSGTYQVSSGQPYTPAQINEATTTGANYYDIGFWNVFNGFESARPFSGSPSAPVTSVGIFAGDACLLTGVGCGAPPNQLISLNAIKQSGSVVNVTANDVRFIENTGRAQQIFGTPFGNVGRNTLRDAMTNTANFSVTKKIRFSERASFEIRATALNVFNHYNFTGVDPFLLHAGLSSASLGFGDPSLTDASGRRFFVGGKLTF